MMPRVILLKKSPKRMGADERRLRLEKRMLSASWQSFGRLSGEGSSGGVIIAPSQCRDGILTLLLLCRMLAKAKKPLQELLSELPEYTYLKEKVKGKFNRERVQRFYLDRGFTIQETGDETGGLKALTQGGWVWFRQSKTEPNLIRVIADSKDADLAKRLLDEALHLLRK